MSVRTSTGSVRTDRVLIEGLVCQVRVGVPETERRTPQKLLLDLELALDLRKAGRFDNMADTIDYSAVSREVKALAESKPYILVEAVAESAAGLVLEKFRVAQVLVRVRKFSVPGTESVGVEIVRASTGSARTA